MAGRWRIPAAIVAVALWAGTTMAGAQSVTDPTDADRARFEDCVSKAEQSDNSPKTCQEVVARPCMDEPGGESTQGMNICIAREAALWDEMLNDEYGRLKRGLSREHFDQLREAQRAWISYRDLKCVLVRTVIEGTIASNIAAGCALETVARRAIELHELRIWAGVE